MSTSRRKDPRTQNGTKRRAIRKRVLREEHNCHLCGEPVDKTLPTPHPGSPEVDEIIPVSKGGNPHRRSNCRLAHRACNIRRSNMDLNTWHTLMQQQAEPTKTRHTERRWW